MMCEASPDQNMDELNHQSVTSTVADEVIALRESISESENCSGAKLVITIDDGSDDVTSAKLVITIDGSDDDDGNNHKTTITTDDPCSDTTTTSRSGDDPLLLKTAITSSSRDEETGSIITSDVDGSKCNSMAPMIGYATSSTTSVDERNNHDGELQEGINEADSLPITPPPTVKSTSAMETETILTTITAPSSSSEEKDSKQNIELQNSPTVERPNAAATYMKEKVLEDNGKLNDRLKKRWEERKQERRAEATKQGVQTPTSSPGKKHSSPRHQQRSKFESTIGSSNSDILSKYKSGSSSPEIYPDVVSFGLEDEEGVTANSSPTRTMPSYRKCLSDFGPHSYSSPPRRIGILQADGIVYDDALLLRLARQSRPGQHRRRTSATIKGDDVVDPMTGEDLPVFQTNEVKIHVYDLLTQDCAVEMPFLNCNFPLGRCFKAVNDGCNYLGTGAYHVGVEVNGVEYAYGGNNIPGMSGIFTCIPKESPGYELRDTIELGKVHTTKKIWIRIPKVTALSPLSQRVSAAFAKLTEESDTERENAYEASQNAYTYREIETFAEGHTVVHDMAKEYLGSDYDLLRKNCCTFAHDACLRLGVDEEDIPSWFRNAALVGAQAEDTLVNVDNTVKNVFKCNEESVPLEAEDCSAGFEVIAKMDDLGGSTLTSLKIIESSPEHRLRKTLCVGIPIGHIDPEIAMRETASWT